MSGSIGRGLLHVWLVGFYVRSDIPYFISGLISQLLCHIWLGTFYVSSDWPAFISGLIGWVLCHVWLTGFYVMSDWTGCIWSLIGQVLCHVWLVGFYAGLICWGFQGLIRWVVLFRPDWKFFIKGSYYYNKTHILNVYYWILGHKCFAHDIILNELISCIS